MNLFFWQSFKRHDEFVRTITEELIKNYPPEISHTRPEKKIEQKFNKTLNSIFSQAKDYSMQIKPGIYGKARIGNKFMWTLKDKGYNEALIDNMTQDLLRVMSQKK